MTDTRLLLALAIITLLTGCVSDPVFDDDSPTWLQEVGTVVVNSALREVSVRRCANRTETDEGISRQSAVSSCRNRVEQSEARKKRLDDLEARESAEATQRAFDQRQTHTDTTTVIEQQVNRGSWINQTQKTQRSVIKLEEPYTVD